MSDSEIVDKSHERLFRQMAEVARESPDTAKLIANHLRHHHRIEWAWFCFSVLGLLLALGVIVMFCFVALEFLRAGAPIQGTLSLVTGSASVAAIFAGKRMVTARRRRL